MSRTRGPKSSRELRSQLSRETQAHSELRAVADVRRFKLEEAVRRLRQSESRYKLLAENATDFVSLVDRQGAVLYASPSMGRLFNDGVARCGRLEDLVFPADSEALRKFIANLFEHGGSGFLEFRLQSESREIIWVETSARAITDDGGTVQSVLLASRDISRRKRLELAISDGDAFATFLRHAPAPIAVLDKDMHYIAVTERWLEDFRLDERNVVGRSHYELFPNLPERWKKAHRSALAGNIERNDEDSFEAPDGHTEWLRWELVPWRRANGEIGGIIVFSELITERKKLLGQLVHAQKLEAVGQMIGGVAHDYNNLLGIVLGNLDYLADYLPQDEKVRRRLRSALDAAERGADITRSLLSIAQRKHLELQRQDLNELLIETTQLLRSALGQQIRLQSQRVESRLIVSIDAQALGNALVNLALNARAALKDKQGAREVLLRTRVERVAASPLLSAGWYAVLDFSDNGCGMSEAVRLQALEPFFSTKQRRHGTGLGLSVVAGLAEQLGGTVQIRSAPDAGTTVSIYLPVDEAELSVQAKLEAERVAAESKTGLQDSPVQVAGPAVVQAGRALASSTGAVPGSDAAVHCPTVLIVDDEVALCELASTWFRSLGLEPECAYSAAQALAMLESRRFDLLFTDVVMPGQFDGIELAHKVKYLYPQTRMLITSGYAESLASGMADLPAPLISKPYRKPQLAAAIERLGFQVGSLPSP
jgi:two-component system cell cycle sensor histidine kinase/response regulator CckA